jgi:undecaprenyl-diphosphatase
MRGEVAAELVAGLFGLAMLALFLAVTSAVLLGETAGVDAWLLRALRQVEEPAAIVGPRWVRDVAVTITTLGNNLTLLAAALTGLAWLFFRGDRRAQLVLLVVSIGGLLLNLALKLGIDRPRPAVVPWLSSADAWSFPSGHAMMTMVIFLALAVLIGRGIKDARIRYILVAVAVTGSLATGATRVMLGVHYPSDVFAGWLLALGWCAACWLWDRRGREGRFAGTGRGGRGGRGEPYTKGGGSPDWLGLLRLAMTVGLGMGGSP